jgi:hypothetical protein
MSNSIYKNINGRLYINTHLFGMIPVQDYLAFLKINKINAKKHVHFKILNNSEAKLDFTVFENEKPDLPKEELCRYCIEYVKQYYTTSYNFPVGTKYHQHREYILEILNQEIPSFHWSIKAKNDSEFYITSNLIH